jgi:hypothetical protein
MASACKVHLEIKSMLRAFSQRQVPVAPAIAFYFALQLVLFAQVDSPNPTTPPDELPAPEGATSADEAASPSAESSAQSFVGTNQCVACHRQQANAWAETDHALAFTHLPEKYHNDPECLSCHVTGFGELSGYVAGTSTDLLMVGCESCHGPGARHVEAVQRFILSDTVDPNIEQELRETISKTPPNSVCVKCHATQAHQSHPAYEDQTDLQASSESVVHGNPALGFVPHSSSVTAPKYTSRYNIKTCGSCHYVEYSQWRTEKHSALAAMLPPLHLNDQDCRRCHPRADAATVDQTAGGNSHPIGIGVACESCHGPALEHVRFNVQFINGPRLGPRLEQAARHSITKGSPSTSCVQCHTRENHRQHPQFDEE